MTPEERKSYAKALGHQQPGATWTNIPPMFSGRQVAGTSGTTGLGILGLGKYEMPDGSSQVSWGLAQPALDAYRSMRYGLGYEQDPNAPPGYVSEDAISRGAFGAAGAMATGGIGATTAARAAGRAMVPEGAIGSNAVPASKAPIKVYHGTSADFEGPLNPRVGIADNAYAKNGVSFFTPDKDLANQFALTQQGGRMAANARPRVIPAEIDQNANIFDYRAKGTDRFYADFLDGGNSSYRGEIPNQELMDRFYTGYWSIFNDYNLLKHLKANKYNGFVEKEGVDVSYGMFNDGMVKHPYTGETLFSSGIPGLHATEDDY